MEQWAAFGLATSDLLAGGFQRASELADVVLDIADQTGQMHIPARSLRAHVDAYLGRSEAGRAMASEAIDAATAAGESAHLSVAYAALAVVETCAGDVAAAARAYARSREVGAEIGLAHAGAQRACLNEVEVAAAAGRIEQAEAAMLAFDAMSNDASPTWSSGIRRRASAAILSAKGDLAGRPLGARGGPG